MTDSQPARSRPVRAASDVSGASAATGATTPEPAPPAAHHPAREELGAVVRQVAEDAQRYLASLDERPVRTGSIEAALAGFREPLPQQGVGAAAALRRLVERGTDAAVTSGGPRCFHFVMGGSTPAALGADWWACTLDQLAYAWVSSPLAVELEKVALSWLRQLFGLPAAGGGLMTTGATMANYVGLAAARQWWGQRHGSDVSQQGLTGLPPVPVFSSGYVHASSVKALSMLGIGRSAVRRLARGARGRLDVDGLRRALAALDGPAILIGNAGEVNMGDFDPIATLADIAKEHGAWLHVDGAFGLFAAVSPRTAHLLEGLPRAHSITVDGHKWLNVPYDCGFAFVQDPTLLVRTFTYSGDYLPDPDDPRPNFGSMGPESSRRARAFAVWATLAAYGRHGVRAMVERHLDLAQRMAARVDAAPDLQRLADVPLNIVCFRYDPGGLDEPALDALNERLGAALLEDGRVYVGTTRFEGKVALRPALVNWRTREQDVDVFVDVVREVGARVAARR